VAKKQRRRKRRFDLTLLTAELHSPELAVAPVSSIVTRAGETSVIT
jgi:hypothetical protein